MTKSIQRGKVCVTLKIYRVGEERFGEGEECSGEGEKRWRKGTVWRRNGKLTKK